MAEGVKTIPRVLLGEAIKQLRGDRGRTLDELAAVVGKDRPRMVKVVDGTGTLSTEELADLIDYLEATPTQRTELLALGVEARKRSRSTPYMDLAPEWQHKVAWLEAIARDIWVYQKGVFPNLIQSPAYVDAMMTVGEGIWFDDSDGERANRVAFRLQRQRSVFDAVPPKRVELFLTDDALVAEVGGPAVMRDQILHVLDFFEKQSNVTIRMVPVAARGNPAQGGGLTMLRFGEVLRPVGFSHTVYGPSPYLDNVDDTERLLRAFNKLRELALSPEQTRALLEAKLKEK
jgi:hypothetical protein